MPVDLSRDLVVRWDNPEPAHVALLEKAGITALAPSDVQFVSVSELGNSQLGRNVALTAGLWPGISKPPAVGGRGDETASASVEPWVDSNGYWIGYLRALYPERPPALGYLPDKLGDRGVPFDSLELALIEAWTAGGNYVLALEKHYREALLRGDPKATAAWEQLGRTGRWLREHIDLFRQPALPIVTALVDSGAATAEIGNLLYRRNVSPFLAPVTSPPPPDPQRRLALVAANIKQPSPELVRRILAHAEAGTRLVVATGPSQQWWRIPALKPIRRESDREFHALGKGHVVAYLKPIADPSEFALDVIDIINHKNRAVRLWNALAVIGLVTSSPRNGELLLHLVNYGSPIDFEVQARVQGSFTKATLLRPDASPVSLKTAKRGTTTEVLVPEIKRLGVVVFS